MKLYRKQGLVSFPVSSRDTSQERKRANCEVHSLSMSTCSRMFLKVEGCVVSTNLQLRRNAKQTELVLISLHLLICFIVAIQIDNVVCIAKASEMSCPSALY